MPIVDRLGGRGQLSLAQSGRSLARAAVLSFALTLGASAIALTAADPPPGGAPLDYPRFTADIRSAYEEAREKTIQAATVFSEAAQRGYPAQEVERALALYGEAAAAIDGLLARHAELYRKLPILFAQLEYLKVKGLSGMAVIAAVKGNGDEARRQREALIELADINRRRMAWALAHNVLPQFHDLYRQLDTSFRLALAEAHVWIALDAEAAGHPARARQHFRAAIALTDDPARRTEIRALLEKLGE